MPSTLTALTSDQALEIAAAADARDAEHNAIIERDNVGFKSGKFRIYARDDIQKLGDALSGTPAEERLEHLVSALSKNARHELMALLWIGRDGGDFAEMLIYAQDNSSDHDVQYITEKPLGEYIRAGLEELGL